VINVKQVKYVGELDADLPSLGLFVVKNDVIDVPDDFENGLFQDAVTAIPAPTKQPKATVEPVISTETTASAE
jgi:hypothetical protein